MRAALEIAATVDPNVHQWVVRQGRNTAGTPCFPELTTESRINADLSQTIQEICDRYECRYSAMPVQIGTTFSGKPSLGFKYTIFDTK
jgi:hypothetical protein